MAISSATSELVEERSPLIASSASDVPMSPKGTSQMRSFIASKLISSSRSPSLVRKYLMINGALTPASVAISLRETFENGFRVKYAAATSTMRARVVAEFWRRGREVSLSMVNSIKPVGVWT